MQTVLICAALVTLLAGGCNRANGRPPDGATVPTEAPATSTTVATTTTIAYDVPAVIDEAYVERVMAALDQVLGDGIRIVARERRLTEEFLDHLTAIYTQSEFELHFTAWEKEGREGFTRRPPNPGNPRTDVQRLVTTDRECVVAQVDRDFSATVIGEEVASTQHYIALVPGDRGPNPRNLNMTPWRMAFDGDFSDGSQPEEPCREQ